VEALQARYRRPLIQRAAGGGTSAPSDYLHGAIVSDLMSLIAHVQASMELIEQANPRRRR
jgi:hypothetical protein